MKIEITSKNLDNLATKVAAAANSMGFSRNEKPMVASQALKLISTLAGFKNEHVLIAALCQERCEKIEKDTIPGKSQDALKNLRKDLYLPNGQLSVTQKVEVLALLSIMVTSVQSDKGPAWKLECKNGSGPGKKSAVLIDQCNDLDLVVAVGWQHAYIRFAMDKTKPVWDLFTDLEKAEFLVDETWPSKEHLSKAYTEKSFEIGALSRNKLEDYAVDVCELEFEDNLSSEELRSEILEKLYPAMFE